MKKIIIIASLLILASCAAAEADKQAIKSAKAAAGSGRINASQEHSKDLLKDLE